MRRIASTIAVFLLSSFLTAFSASCEDNPSPHASPYKVASAMSPLPGGLTVESLLDNAAHKRRRRHWDCAVAPGLCTWWEHCCPVWNSSGKASNHVCVDEMEPCRPASLIADGARAGADLAPASLRKPRPTGTPPLRLASGSPYFFIISHRPMAAPVGSRTMLK